jgi:lipopolysaccharide/colanic/teichoic acid biosynthesis glycosyltransferase
VVCQVSQAVSTIVKDIRGPRTIFMISCNFLKLREAHSNQSGRTVEVFTAVVVVLIITFFIIAEKQTTHVEEASFALFAHHREGLGKLFGMIKFPLMLHR